MHLFNLYRIHENDIVDKEVLENPVFVESKRPGQVLPALCNEHQVNFFVAASIGVGFKSALLSKGIYVFIRKRVNEKNIIDTIKIFYMCETKKYP